MAAGKGGGRTHPVRRSIATSLHAAGIQSGYTFFAPNIPGYHKLIFELNYQDGRVEYESPHFSGKAAALRLDSLLARLGDDRYEPLREVVVKMLALSIWRERPDVKKIRATFGSVSPRASVILSMARANRSNRCSATISACAGRRNVEFSSTEENEDNEE